VLTIDLTPSAQTDRVVATMPPEAQHAVMLQLALVALHSLQAERDERVAERARQRALPTRERSWDWQNYCTAHGEYIGDPYGADYMCGWCEEYGDSLHEYALSLGRTQLQGFIHRNAERNRRIGMVISMLTDGFDPSDAEREHLIAWAMR
jgi:hypothetical protein